jgi:hypothetical protein
LATAKYHTKGKPPLTTVTAPTRDGLTKGEIDRELRKKAFQSFGGEAWGIRNTVYEIAQCLKCEEIQKFYWRGGKPVI